MARELLPYQLAERSIIKKYRKQLWNPFIAAVKRYELVEPGDKIAVCISGGKDSMLLAKLFQELHRHSDVPFEVIYLVMDPGYNEINRAKIESNAKLLNIPITVFETDIFDVANNADEHPCYLCARMRRGHLYRKAKDLGCNKIALGHHLNDVIETTVMAMFYNELSFIQCACRFTENCTICDNGGGGSKRQEIKILLRHLKQNNPDIEKSIFNAIHAVCTETFPGFRRTDGDHSFLEDYATRRGE